jgi:hypothetical protein
MYHWNSSLKLAKEQSKEQKPKLITNLGSLEMFKWLTFAVPPHYF